MDSEQIEKDIIGCLLINNNLIRECYLQPHNFMNKDCRVIFCKILDLYEKNDGNVDGTLLVEEFNGDEYMQSLILDCMDNLVTPTSFPFFQEKQEEYYKANKIKDVVEDYYDKREIDYSTFIDKIKNIDNECNSSVNSSSTLRSAEDIFELITTNKSKLEFKKFNFLQNRLGIIEHTVNIIAARTSQGKSAFALNLMNDLSLNYKCLYFNMEMTEKEIYQRLVSINSQVPINSFTSFNQKNIYNGIFKGIEEIHKRKIKIYQGSKNIKALRTILTKESRKEHCIAFIDYIGYVNSNKINQKDTERIGEVVREIQNMTKDLNITVFMIAQINREGNEAPTLVNLKDSGELEQTAHCVMIIHNPDKDLNNLNPIIELTIPKNRDGQCFMMKMEFNKATQTFNPIAKS